jgi:hypothetical protein
VRTTFHPTRTVTDLLTHWAAFVQAGPTLAPVVLVQGSAKTPVALLVSADLGRALADAHHGESASFSSMAGRECLHDLVYRAQRMGAASTVTMRGQGSFALVPLSWNPEPTPKAPTEAPDLGLFTLTPKED